MEAIQTIMIIALLFSWTLVSVGLLVSIIQSVVNERRREKRAKESDARDQEYHEKRMKLLDE